MTASGGDSGEKPQNEGEQGLSEGTYEAPPIEQSQAPSGFEAPPQQPFGAPPYPGAGYGYPAPASGTNTLAIGSLVASVIGLLCGIGSIIGIVLGVIALNQIKQTRQGGYGLAVAGIVVGAASLVISLIWMIYAIN